MEIFHILDDTGFLIISDEYVIGNTTIFFAKTFKTHKEKTSFTLCTRQMRDRPASDY